MVGTKNFQSHFHVSCFFSDENNLYVRSSSIMMTFYYYSVGIVPLYVELELCQLDISNKFEQKIFTPPFPQCCMEMSL